MHHLLEMTDQGQHRQRSLNDHAIIPLAALADTQMLRVPIFLREAGIGKHHGLPRDLVDNGLEGTAIIDVRGVTVPVDDQAQMVLQQTQLASDDPAVVREALAPNLPITAAFAPGMDEFDPVGIDNTQQTRLRHEAIRPVLMRVEQAKQARTRGQVRKQGPVITTQPAVEGAIADSLQGEQQGQRHHFARIQLRLGMFLGGRHRIIYAAKQFSDKIYSRHGDLLLLRVSYH